MVENNNSSDNDKKGIRAGPVFERVSRAEDAVRYSYDKNPGIVGPPSVGPSEKVVKQEILDMDKKPEQKPVPPAPVKSEQKQVPQMKIPEIDEQIKEQTKLELREVARSVAQEKYAKKEVVDTLEKALANPTIKGMRWGIVGIGQAGGRLVEQFSKFGYPACVINTAKQDMATLNIPEENKLFMDYALGGAGKDMSVGEAAVVEYEKDIVNLMRRTFGQNVDTVIVCVGGGGGTGSGGILHMINMVSRFGLPVAVLYTLPLASEGSVTKSNAIRALDRVARQSVEGKVSALIIVDNSKIEQLYPNITAAQFWKVANFDIVNSLNMFNTLCRCDTDFDALDPMDFLRIFSTGNCTIFGKIRIPIDIQDGQVTMFDDELANSVLNNLQGGLLADGFSLKETVSGGIIITGPESILNQIPAVNINFMYHRLNELIGNANIYRGLYKDDSTDNHLTVYTILSGLGLPIQRVESLLREAQVAMNAIESKSADKSKMIVDVQQQTTDGEQNIYEGMKQRSTPFGRLTQLRGKRRGPTRG